MSSATLEWILGLAGTLIMLLLMANGFWIKRLVQTIDKLKESVNGILVEAGRKYIELADFKDACEERNDQVNRRLNDHSHQLKQHSEDIAVIKEKIKHHEGKP